MRFSVEQRRWRLAERHRLIESRRIDDVATIADDVLALHSSDPATVFLSALVRMQNPSIGAIEDALYKQRSVVRHHAMRRTLWVMTPSVAQIAHGAATAKIARAERKRTVAAIMNSTNIGDVDAWLDDALARVTSLLKREGPLPTRGIGLALPDLVIPVTFGVKTKHPAAINAHTKVLQGAGFDGNLVRAQPTGTWLSAEYLWTPVETWLGHPLVGVEEIDAAPQLLNRWLRRFGPATETDIRWWFGWTAGLTRRALAASNAAIVELDNGPGFVADDDLTAPEDPGPWVRLLPGLDPTPMGWKERDWYLDQAHVPRLFDRFGNAGPTIWADGQIVGGWIQRPDGEIVSELTVGLSSTHQHLLDGAVDELQAVLDDAVVRPRFPALVHKELFAG